MQTLSRPKRRNSRGYALMVIMVFLTVCLVIFASMMYWITTGSTVTSRNNQFNMSTAAAEAVVEKVLSQMNYDYVAQSLSNSGTYYGNNFTPTTVDQANWGWPVQYVFSGTNGSPTNNQISVSFGPWTTNSVPLNSQFAGLYGLEQDCVITATATPISTNVTYKVPATVSETIQFASIPLFQFAIFYNMDLEIDPGQSMVIRGQVWSNGGIWSGTGNVSYNSTVSAVGTVYYAPTATDPFCSGKNDGGTPIGNFAFQPTSGNDRITMPIGTNNDPATVEGIINLPPPAYALNTAAAFTTNGQQYLANEADLYLTNFPNGTNCMTNVPMGTNMVMYYQDAALSYRTQMPYDLYIITNISPAHHGLLASFTNYVPASQWTNSLGETNRIWYAGYSFVTNDLFYDWREGWNGGSGVNNGRGKAVQAVQIDVSLFNIWLTNAVATNSGFNYNNQCQLSSHKSHPIDSIYVYNAVPLTGTTLPAVRVYNGIMLPVNTAPKGFSVATAMPMYVWGDYNAKNSSGSSLGQNSTTHTWPAGLMADSITILSNNWLDSNTNKLPTPTTTTVNAAMLEGIVRSTNISSQNPGYSGGLENFLRLLESWSQSIPLWYNGSIVVMFPSQYATNYQVPTGNYYNAPARNWAFDTNFTQQAGLPPLTPQCKGVVRANWKAY